MTAPRPTEAIVLANLLSNIADALRRAALDLRMIESLDREREEAWHDAVRAMTMPTIRVTFEPLTEPEDEPEGEPLSSVDVILYCRNCGQRIRGKYTTQWHIDHETVTCPTCGLDAQRPIARQRPATEVGYPVMKCEFCGAFHRHRETCWNCGSPAALEAVIESGGKPPHTEAREDGPTETSIRCAHCGNDTPTAGLRISDIIGGTVVCPACSRSAQKE